MAIRDSLICTVRGCGELLVREEKRFVCPRNHSFDIARSGYVNLLLPQDRRSSIPGDSPAAVDARRRFVDSGYATALANSLIDRIDFEGVAAILDVGCGEGFHLDLLLRRAGLAAEGCGVDLSARAIELAARRHPEPLWLIANADRVLPFAKETFDLVTSITAPRNREEMERILRPGGRLVVAVPAPDDVIELRAAVLGDGERRDRTAAVIDELGDRFKLVDQFQVSAREHLTPDLLRDLLASTYRGARHKEQERAERLSDMTVTMSRDVLVFSKI